jgi:hypothetical protein
MKTLVNTSMNHVILILAFEIPTFSDWFHTMKNDDDYLNTYSYIYGIELIRDHPLNITLT